MEQQNELDPRIQIELENLNTATEEINKLEIELEEANSTFRILYNESTRRLKLLTKKLGSCIEKSRPYYESSERVRVAQNACQKAAANYQRASEIHAAAKETVALAEERFMTNSHNWPFDNAWQEMLNNSTQKVAEAEKKKAEAHAEHQLRAHIFSQADLETQQIEERQRRNIQKSRPYFEEKQLCQEQLETQKNRIQELEIQIKSTKASYAASLKNLEKISEEIHKTRADLGITPPGPREPGVGAELCPDDDGFETCDTNDMTSMKGYSASKDKLKNLNNLPIADIMNQMENDNSLETASLDTNSIFSEDKIDEDYALSADDTLENTKRGFYGDGIIGSSGMNSNSNGMTTNSRNEPADATGNYDNHELNLEELRQKVKVLAVRPVTVEGGDGQTKDCWESELNETVNKLDRLMMLQENSNARNKNLSSQHTPSITHNSPIIRITEKPPKAPVNHSLANGKGKAVDEIVYSNHTPTHGGPTNVTTAIANGAVNVQQQPSSNTTKTFLNNSLQAVQQKMEDLLPTSQTSSSVMQNMKELPLLSRISNEISNTANTVKVLKRRLSLN